MQTPSSPTTLEAVLGELQKERAARAVLERAVRLLHRRLAALEARTGGTVSTALDGASSAAVEQPLASMQREVERVTQHIERQLQRFEEIDQA